jgi:hypothetical protein
MKKKEKGSIIVITHTKKPKKKPKEIFIITSIHFGYIYINKKRSGDGVYHSFRKRTSKTQKKYFSIKESRTWRWFTDFKTAEKSVLENWDDIFEGNLSYAVIERVPEGTVTSIPTEEYWYKWEGPWPMTEDGKIGGYKPEAKKPKYDHIVQFWG